MALKTTVLVNEVNNLSDARYCAGMGVEMVGFCIDKKNPNFLPYDKLKEISSWVAGVKIVGELDSAQEDIPELIKALNLDIVQIPPVDKEILKNISVPVILKIPYSSQMEKIMEEYKDYSTYFLIKSDQPSPIEIETEYLNTLCRKYRVLLAEDIFGDNLEKILSEVKPAGISLLGGNEIKPGLKNFDRLADVFELLEIND